MRTVIPAICLAVAACALGTTAQPAGAAALPESTQCETPGTATDPLGTTLDLLDTTIYTVHTALRRPGGKDLERDTVALLGVPTPVSVDDDVLGSAELTVTLVATSTSKVALTVDKTASAPASLPVRVEARVDVPGNVTEDVEVAFGYDAREGAQAGSVGTAPVGFRTDFDFVFGQELEPKGTQPAGSRSRLGVDISVASPGSALAIVGETFVRTPTGKRDLKGAAAKLTPVPAQLRLSAEMTCRGPVQTVNVGASSSGKTTNVTADVTDEREVADPTTRLPVTLRRKAKATIEALPGAVALDYVSDSAAATDTLDYSGAGSIGLLDVTIDDLVPNSQQLGREVRAVLRNVPKEGFTLTRESGGDAPRTAVALDANGPPIGSLEVGAAKGHPVSFLEHPEAFFEAGELGLGRVPGYAFATGEDIAVRVAGLSHALVDTADQANPFTSVRGLRIEATSKQQPFLVRQLKEDRVVNARVLDLPSDLTLRVTKDPQRVEYTASQKIGRLRVTAHDPTGLVRRDTGADPEVAVVRVDDVPRCLTLNILDGGFGGTTAAGVDHQDPCPADAIGRAEALITTGTPESPVEPASDNVPGAAEDGLALEDRPGHFTLFARATAVRGLSFSTEAQDARKAERTHFFIDSQKVLTASLEHPADVARPLSVKVERGVKKEYLDARLASIPAVLGLTVTDHSLRREDLAPQDECGPAEISENLCEDGVEIDYDASSAIPPSGATPAFELDTNAGLRRTPNLTGKPVAGMPNLHVGVKRLPAAVFFCKATNGLCVPDGSGRFVGDLSLKVDTSEAMELDLFDCKEDGLDDVCNRSQRTKGDQQVSTVGDIERIKFLELELDRPPIQNDVQGHVFLNTTHRTPSGGTVREVLDGDAQGPTGNDVFIHARSSDSCNEHKIKRMEADFDEVSANDRLVVFEIDNGGAQGCIAAGMDVKSSSGSMRCRVSGTQIDAGIGFPGGDISNDLCSERL